MSLLWTLHSYTRPDFLDGRLFSISMDEYSPDNHPNAPPLRPIRTEEQDHAIEPEPSRRNVTTRISANGAQQERFRKGLSAAHVQPSNRSTSSQTSSVATKSPATAPPALTRPQQSARRGSLRNVVRRIFGRKPRQQEDSPRPPSSRHGHHKSVC